MGNLKSAGPLARRDDASSWTLWFGSDGEMMMLPLVGGADADTDEGGDSWADSDTVLPAATPTSVPVPSSTSTTLSSQQPSPTTTSTTASSRIPSSTPSSATASASLSSGAGVPQAAIITAIVLGACLALAAMVWLLTWFLRARQRRSHELEFGTGGVGGSGEAFYPFGPEFGLFRGGWASPKSPASPGKGAKDRFGSFSPPEPARLAPMLSPAMEEISLSPLPKGLADGPYPTSLQLPADIARADPFADSPRPRLTIANMTSRDVSETSDSRPTSRVGTHRATPETQYTTGMFKVSSAAGGKSPWAMDVEAARSPALLVTRPSSCSSAAPPADGWNTFKATVSSAISSFSQFARPSQVHMPDSFTRSPGGPQRSLSMLTTSSDGSVRRARALDRAQMARVISLDKGTVKPAEKNPWEKMGSGLPSPQIATPNPFEDPDEEVIRFPAAGMARSASLSQPGRPSPRRAPTASSTYSRSSFR